MYTEDDFEPISALQHLAFCERQWGLMYLEQIWSENWLTTQGGIMHERAHQEETEVRGDIIITRGLRLHSYQLGIVGIADIVEFHRETLPESQLSATTTISLAGRDGAWRVVPVEYKRGSPKIGRCDMAQVCAQALCLEEMLDVSIEHGFIYYGQPQRRCEVVLDSDLRTYTKDLSTRLHALATQGVTPSAPYKKHCRSCSLYDLCLPKQINVSTRVGRYMKNALDFEDESLNGAS